MQYLNRFVAARFPGASTLAQVAGGIPVTNVLPAMVADGFLVAGDAVHQSDPLTAGHHQRQHGGLFAAQVAIRAIRQGDTSACFLRRYEQM